MTSLGRFLVRQELEFILSVDGVEVPFLLIFMRTTVEGRVPVENVPGRCGSETSVTGHDLGDLRPASTFACFGDTKKVVLNSRTNSNSGPLVFLASGGSAAKKEHRPSSQTNQNLWNFFLPREEFAIGTFFPSRISNSIFAVTFLQTVRLPSAWFAAAAHRRRTTGPASP